MLVSLSSKKEQALVEWNRIGPSRNSEGAAGSRQLQVPHYQLPQTLIESIVGLWPLHINLGQQLLLVPGLITFGLLGSSLLETTI